MAQIVKLKRTSIAGRIPTTSNIEVGELAFNSNDKSLFIRGDSNAIVAIHDESTLHIDTTNNRIGIGTTSPSRQLQVKNTSGSSVVSITASGFAQLALGTTSDDNYAQLILDTSTNKLQLQNGGGTAVADRGITLDSSENVGIGTSSPDQKLHVEFSDTDTSFSGGGGGAWGSEGIRIENTSSTSNTMAMLHFRNNDADIHVAGIRQGTDNSDLGFFFEGSEKVRFTNDGNVIIGATSAVDGAHFQHFQSSVRHQSFQSSNGDLAIVTDNNTNPAVYIKGTGTADLVNIFDNTTEVFTIRDGGNVGIGDATPGHKLVVTANSTGLAANIGNTNSNGFGASIYGGNGTNYAFRVEDYNGNERFRVTGGGRVGIGTTSPAKLLHLSETADGSKLRLTRGGVSEWDFSIGNTSTLTGVGSGALEILPQNSGTANEIAIGTAGTTAPLVHITNSQNYFSKKIGIGTTSPDTILDITSSGVHGLILNQDLNNSSASSRIFLKDGVRTNTILNVSGNLEFRTGATIGSTSGTKRLVVRANGTIRFNEAYTFPASDGSANQVLQTDGSGNLSFATVQAGGGGTVSEAFKNIAVSGQSNVVADGATDTLTFAAGAGMTITTNASTDTVTFSAGTDFQDSDGDTKIQVEESSDEDIIRFDVAGNEFATFAQTGNEHFIRLFRRGTAAKGSFSFDGSGLKTDVDAGYNSLMIRNNGTEQVRVDSSGRVGIGTTAPSAPLHVVGADSGIKISSAAGDRPHLSLINGTTEMLRLSANNVYGAIGDGTDGQRYLVFKDGGVGIGTTTPNTYTNQKVLTINGTTHGRLDFETGGTLRGSVYADSGTLNLDAGGNQIRFFTGNAEQIRIDASGRLIIGATSSLHSSADLQIQGASGNYARIMLKDQDGTNQHAFIDETGGNLVFTSQNGTSHGPIRFSTYDGTDTLERMRVHSNGNVGIGTTAPAETLHIGSGHVLFERGVELRSKDTGGTQRTLVRINGSNDLEYGYSGSGAVKFMGGGSYTERMRIHTNGNIGIGTDSPSAKLQIRGGTSGLDQISISSNTTANSIKYAGIIMTNYANTTTALIGGKAENGTTSVFYGSSGTDHRGIQNHIFYTNASATATSGNTERMRIDSSGNVIVGSTSAANSSAGFRAYSGGNGAFTIAGTTLTLNRLSSEGEILSFQKDTSAVGSIGTFSQDSQSNFYIAFNNGSSDVGLGFGHTSGTGRAYYPCRDNGSGVSAAIDLGTSTYKYKDLHISGSANIGTNILMSNASTSSFMQVSSDILQFGTSSSDPLAFFTNNVERARIDSSGNFDFNGNNLIDVNQINGVDTSGWLDFNMDTDGLYPQSTTDNQTVLGSITHMNFVGDSNSNGTGGIFNFGYGTTNTDAGTFTRTASLNRSGDLDITGQLTVGSGDNIVNAGNMTIDVAGDLTIDADGGDIILQDGGTTFGKFTQMIGGLGISAGSTPTFQQLLSSTKTLFFGHIEVGDNKHIQLGSGSADLKLIHDGSNSYIEAFGTGNLIIKQSTDDADIVFQSDDGSGGTTEYFALDGSIAMNKFTKDALFKDNVKAYFGDGTDLFIEHDSNNSVIRNGTGNLYIQNGTSGSILIQPVNNESSITALANGAVELYHDNVKTFETTSRGIKVQGPNGYVEIEAKNTSGLHIYTDRNKFYFNAKVSIINNIIESYDNDFQLQRAGSTKLTLTSTGADVTGNLTVSGDLTVNGTTTTLNTTTLDVEDKNITLNKGSGDTSGSADGAGITIQDAVNSSTDASLTWNAAGDKFIFSHKLRMFGNFELPDNVKLIAGDGEDLQIYHSGNDSFISDQGSGNLKLLTDEFRVRNAADSAHIIKGSQSGAVELYFNTGKKLETTSTGIEVNDTYNVASTNTTTSATTQTTIDTFTATAFRSCRYTVQVTNSTDSTFHTTELLLVHDGTTPGITEFGAIFTGAAAEATFDADISSGNVRLRATPASADSMTFKVVRHAITA